MLTIKSQANHTNSTKWVPLLLLFSVLLAGCNTGERAEENNASAQSTLTNQTGTNQAGENPADTNAIAVENSGANCSIPELPTYEQLPEIAHLPDPFLKINGERIQSQEEWRCRRAEIAAQFEKYELGSKPANPDSVSGEFNGDGFTVNVSDKGKHINFLSEIILPAKGEAPYPAIIGIGRSSLDNTLLSELGVAVINFPNGDVGEQLNGGSRGKGKFFELYGADHSASAMMAWAWGVSRLIDALENSDTPIDVTRLGVTGCSRNGKGALVVGAFDERIALTIPQESGSGGSASWRVSDAQKANGQNVQTLSQIVTENVWLTESFKQFSHTATKLPVDHHELMGLVAPRALLVVENTSMEWLGNISTYTTGVVAHTVWQALGKPDAMGMTQMGGHNHCQYPEYQRDALKAYVEKFLVGGGAADTRVMVSDGDFAVDIERWVQWDVPALAE